MGELGMNATEEVDEASAIEAVRKGEPVFIQVTLKIEGRNTAELLASVDRRGLSALAAIGTYVEGIGHKAFGSPS